MPGRFFLIRSLDDLVKTLGAVSCDHAGDARFNISPGEEILVLDAARHLLPMRWGVVPVGRVNARGRPVMEMIINARSETVFDKSAFQGVSRAIVPADGWYEWTGEKRRKTAWRIRSKDGALLAFAAITDEWQAPGGKLVKQVATVTCEPSADVRDIHHRMGVLLRPDQFEIWLNGTEDEARDLMRPYPDGSLLVETASDVDWSAP